MTSTLSKEKEKIIRSTHLLRKGERGIFITRQPPKGEKDDYDIENSWISGGLPGSSRRRRRGEWRPGYSGESG